MSITVGDILRVVAVLNWTDGNIMQNVFNATIAGSGGPFTDSDIVADAIAWINPMYVNLTAAVSENVDGSEVRVYLYDAVDDDWDEVGSTLWAWNPSATTDEIPRGVAALLNAKTTDPDVNGKKYFGGLTEPSATDGLWTAGVLSDLADWGSDWVGTFTGGTSGASWVPGIWSPTGTNFFAFSGTVIIPTIPAYQRRRKRGVGV